jgi:hypothetical protein
MSEPRRHHLVPQSYLRRFADERHQVRAVSRNDLGRSFVTSILNAPVERDFYALETDEGWSQELEKQLGHFEGLAADAVSRILEGWFPPSADDRELVAAFVALQFLRGSDMREAVQGLVGHLGNVDP